MKLRMSAAGRGGKKGAGGGAQGFGPGVPRQDCSEQVDVLDQQGRTMRECGRGRQTGVDFETEAAAAARLDQVSQSRAIDSQTFAR